MPHRRKQESLESDYNNTHTAGFLCESALGISQYSKLCGSHSIADAGTFFKYPFTPLRASPLTSYLSLLLILPTTKDHKSTPYPLYPKTIQRTSFPQLSGLSN